MVRIAMKNVNKRVEPEVSPAKAGLLSIDPKLVLHSSIDEKSKMHETVSCIFPSLRVNDV